MEVEERKIEEEFEIPLEGDEGELELRRHHDVGRRLLEARVADVDPTPALTIAEDATIAETVEGMRALGVDAVIVVARDDDREVVGIFTERDRLLRVGGEELGMRIGAVMTPAPETLCPRHSLAFALNRMTTGRYCHVPIVDDAGAPVAMLSVRELLNFIVECIPEEILNLPPEPDLAQPYRIDSE
ncbi:MAG TPA: CBS domain-containing protein [Anaeromyxobacteraceae bacterium]|nr:CBS domain-containing protein [Anaeromyxobacteraceae bacterium]